jgi:NADP-dependent 3-hydroxy acid dehydrogenase YdfG
MPDGTERVVWITGASSGIGRATAEFFASKKDRVVASARTESALLDLRHAILSRGGACDALVCDIRSEAAVQSAVQKIATSYGRVDALINNAGVTSFEDFAHTTPEEFDRVVGTNLRGTFLATRAVLPSMMERQKGLILNIISYTTKEVHTRSSAYAASKAGVEAMMNVLRAEVRRKGVNVVNVYPGAVSTGIWPESQRQKYADQMLKPEEVAEMVYEISVRPASVTVEECVIRPSGGDFSR